MKNKTLFLIDDDPDDREILQRTLEKIDGTINFMAAPDGKTALERLADRSVVPDMILLDLNMPGMTGKECLIGLKKIEHLKDTPIVIYTTSNHPKEKEETKRLGAADFLTKSNTIQELRLALNKLLRKSGLYI